MENSNEKKHDTLLSVYKTIAISMSWISGAILLSFGIFRKLFGWLTKIVPYDSYIAASLVLTTILLIALSFFISKLIKANKHSQIKGKFDFSHLKLGQHPIISEKMLTKYLNVNWDKDGEMFCLKCDGSLVPNVSIGLDEKANAANFKCAKCNEQYFLKTDNGEFLTRDEAKRLWVAFDKAEKLKQFEALNALANVIRK